MYKVHLGSDKNRSFALKKMKKKFIVETKQQQHVMHEKKLLLAVRSPFIVRYSLMSRQHISSTFTLLSPVLLVAREPVYLPIVHSLSHKCKKCFLMFL